MKLKGKRALITGAASGIGAEIARLFAAEGADLAINYHSRRQAADKLAEACKKHGGRIMTVQADVSEPEPVQEMVARVIETLGGIDILVCSTGINRQSPFVEMLVEDWDEMLKVSLRGVFLCDRFVLPHMLARGSGRIINVTSQLGQIGGVNCAHYCAAKAGIIGLTKSLAREVGKTGITVNCIAPGPIETDFFFNGTTEAWRAEKLASLPLGRFGLAEEVAPSALLLAAEPDGNIFTGQTLGPNSGDVML
ncbi:MAG: SDR family NAD(P)-dependent oxidoreductase [Anaerotruncus rubiinfantis]|jgi:3-oxoacyl-[acyl-carrier protein] reductase